MTTTVVVGTSNAEQAGLDFLRAHGALIEIEQRLGLLVVSLPADALVRDWAWEGTYSVSFDDLGLGGEVIVELALNIHEQKLTYRSPEENKDEDEDL